MPKYHYNVVQGTTAWHDLRLGRVGGSESAALLVNAGKGKLGTGAITLAYKKAAEKLSGLPADLPYESPAMVRGIELEPEAREAYEQREKVALMPCGYVEASEFAGFSPDGLLMKNKHEVEAVIEIKCPMLPEFLRVRHTGIVKPEYFAQMKWGCWLTGCNRADFIAYHPGYEPVIMSYDFAQEQLDEFGPQLDLFEALVKEIMEG